MGAGRPAQDAPALPPPAALSGPSLVQPDPDSVPQRSTALNSAEMPFTAPYRSSVLHSTAQYGAP
eukprot:1282588-Rhodomonas_salina.1